MFAQDRATVEELTGVLRAELPDCPTLSFHHGIPEHHLARVALQFQQNNDCRVLVSDELGGEGRNFQNASTLIHFDLPWSVARVEQRIGRLDRVGRSADKPALSIVLQGPGSMDRALAAVHSEVFKVFTRSVGGLEYALPHLQLELNQAICQGSDSVAQLQASLAERVAQELQDVDESFELSLDASKLQLKDAQDLAEMLEDPVDGAHEGMTLAKWATRLGMHARQLSDETWKFDWDTEQLHRPLPGFAESGFLSGTFSRQRALEDERQQFLGPGHALVDALMQDAACSAEGRASVMLLKLGSHYRRRLFALVLGRCDLGLDEPASPKLPPGLQLRARRHLWPEVQSALVELHPDQEPSATLVRDAELTFQLRSPDTIKARYQKIPPNTLGEYYDTLSLWAAVDEAQRVAIEHIREQRAGIAEQAAKGLEDELRPEIGFLRWKQGTSPSTEIESGIDARLHLIDAIRNERVDVEAVAVILSVQ